jgi:hypothetical protein
MTLMKQIKKKLKYCLLAFLTLPFFLWWISNAANDLLWKVWEVSDYNSTVIHLADNVKDVWEEVVWGSSSHETMLTKITKILLWLVVALSVTMILYNGMMYIIQTWQWKEWKDLMKNIIYIIIGIVIALFSTIIIALIQSASSTINNPGEIVKNPWIDSKIF